MNKSECCAKFNPKPWDKKTFIWKNKKFVKDNVFTLLHIPINFGSVITRLMKRIDSADADCVDYMIFSEYTSKWNMNIYAAVNKKIQGATNISISGKFLSKVYDGPFEDTGKWCEDFEAYAKSKGLKIKKSYMWFTTCPKCAKKYSTNYVVIIGEIN